MTYSELVAAKDAAFREWTSAMYSKSSTAIMTACFLNMRAWQQLVDNFKGER